MTEEAADWRTAFSETGTRDPDSRMNTEFQVRAGLHLRRQVRGLVALARMRGAVADSDEQGGLLGTLFTIRLDGTVRQLAPVLERFSELGSR